MQCQATVAYPFVPHTNSENVARFACCDHTIAGTIRHEAHEWCSFFYFFAVVVVFLHFFCMSLCFAKQNQPEQVLSFGYCSTHCSRFVNWKCTDVRRGLCSFCCSRLTQNDSEWEMKMKQNENREKTSVAQRVLFQWDRLSCASERARSKLF